jgi:hypothetical protein
MKIEKKEDGDDKVVVQKIQVTMIFFWQRKNNILILITQIVYAE